MENSYISNTYLDDITRKTHIKWSSHLCRQFINISLKSKQEKFDIGLIYKSLNITHSDSSNDQQFWQTIKKLNLPDPDDIEITSNYINRLSYYEKRLITNKLPFFINKINNILGNTNSAINTLSYEQKNNILSHIICKGKDFYLAVCGIPDIALYLINNSYPIYTWLH